MATDHMDGALKRVLKPGAENAPGCDPELNAAYVEGRLRPAERRSVEAHLAACADCRRLVTEWLEETTPGPVRKPARAWWPWAVPALAGVVVVGSAVLYYQPHRPPETKPAPPAAQELAALPRPAPVAAPAPPEADRPAKQTYRARRDAIAPSPPPAVAEPVGQVAASRAAREEAAAAAAVADEGREGERKKAAPAAPAALALRQAAPTPLPDGSAIRSQVRRGERIWAVSEAGGLFRSEDSGRTWTRVESPATMPLTQIGWDEQETVLRLTDREGNHYRVQP